MTEPLGNEGHVAVPRVAERLLEALGAHRDLRDALLGDMAEELAIRAAWDGERAARRWYRREAWRVAPHLLRDGARRLRWAEVRRLAGIAASAYVLSAMAMVPLGIVVARLAASPAASHPGGPPAGPGTLAGWGLSLLLALGALSPVLGGWVAAALDEESPLVAALALGSVVFVVHLVVAAAVGPGGAGPLALGVVRAALLAALAALGGMLRVWIGARRDERSRRAAAQ